MAKTFICEICGYPAKMSRSKRNICYQCAFRELDQEDKYWNRYPNGINDEKPKAKESKDDTQT